MRLGEASAKECNCDYFLNFDSRLCELDSVVYIAVPHSIGLFNHLGGVIGSQSYRIR